MKVRINIISQIIHRVISCEKLIIKGIQLVQNFLNKYGGKKSQRRAIRGVYFIEKIEHKLRRTL